MIRLGIIGLRGQAAFWAKAARATPGFQLRFGYHPNRSHHLRRASFEQTDDLKRLARCCDLLVIASPTHMHLAALRRLAPIFPGIVLVEKPVLFSLSECRWLLKHLRKSFRDRIYVAQNWRFLPWVEKVRGILQRGEADRVLCATFQMTHDFAFKPAYSSSWRSDRKSHPIGPAQSQGIHFIDLVHHLLGPIHLLDAVACRLGKRGTAPDTASILLRTTRGEPCSLHTSYAAPTSDHVRITTSRSILTYQDGALKLQQVTRRPLHRASRPPLERTLFRATSEQLKMAPLRAQLKKLRGQMEGGRSAGLATLKQGMANVAVLAAVEKSLRLGRPVFLREFPLYGVTVRGFATFS